MSSLELSAVAPPPETTVPPPRRSLSLTVISVLTVSTLLFLWWAVTTAELIEPLFLPGPQAVAQKGWELVTQGYMDASLWQHLGASLGRIGVALL
ncbi:MAG TPA: taurine ABC transporter permease, partial [Cystobacter sp.]